MATQVVTRTDVRVCGGQMSIEKCLRKLAGAVVHVNIGQLLVARNRKLNGRRAIFQTKADRKTLVISDVVLVAKKLLATAENVEGIRLKISVQAELAVTRNGGFLTHYFVNSLHQVYRVSQVFSRRIRDLRVQQRVSHSVKRCSDGQPGLVVRLLGNKSASRDLVVAANEIVDQTLLLGPQCRVGLSNLSLTAPRVL